MICKLPNASEELKRFAVERYPCIILELPNASEELIKLAVELDNNLIRYIPNPSQEILDYVYKNHREVFDEYFEKVES